jgi:hypothetical protein
MRRASIGPLTTFTLLATLVARCAPGEIETRSDAAQQDASRQDASPRSDADPPSDATIDAMTDGRGADASTRDTGVTRADATTVDARASDPYESARVACVAEINRYRAMLMLPPYERWREGEACADQQAEFDARTGIPHNGFSMSICSPRGNGQNECPRYGGPEALNGCLAQMWAEGPSPDGMWSVAHGHYLNMVGDYMYMGFRVRHTRVACGFSAGGWMVQNFQ